MNGGRADAAALAGPPSSSSSPNREDVKIAIDDSCAYSTPDVFKIPSKNASIQRLRQWRKATFALNTSRRFRYTASLKKDEERDKILGRIRSHAQVIRATILLKRAGELASRNGPIGSPVSLPTTTTTNFEIGREQLLRINREHSTSALERHGGVKELARLLRSNIDEGIRGDDDDLVQRRNTFGANTYPRKKGRSFWIFLWEAFQDLTLIILMVAAVASLVLGIKTEGIKQGWYDGGSIAFAVLLVVLVTAISDYRQSLQFRNLNEEKRNIRLEVVRGGRRVDVSIYDLVVGDVVPLKIGDQVPADGILISGHSLEIDESSMTGESKLVHKDQRSPFLMSGCKVADGYGTMLVTAVGIDTEWGLLMASISEDNGEETPLQVRLNGIATFIGIIGVSVAVIVLIVLSSRYFTGHTREGDGTHRFVKGKTTVGQAVDGAIEILTIAVTIVVVAVPEGLPLAVTLTLAFSMKKMMADKALASFFFFLLVTGDAKEVFVLMDAVVIDQVRRLSACETMGSATTICSDKTGTLTLNQMTVVEAHIGSGKLDPPSKLAPNIRSLLVEGISQNTTGSVFTPPNGGAVEVKASPTEKALLLWGVQLGMNFSEERSKTRVLHVFPFNSVKKRGGVAVQDGSTVRIHWKGAAEIILASCTRWLGEDGSENDMDENTAFRIRKGIEHMASRTLRCVAFAYRPHDGFVPNVEEQLDQRMLPEDDLIFLAVVGIMDPCRPGVKEAVKLCQQSHVKVRMVTGDNIQTAKAIALECGILGEKDNLAPPIVIEGSEFRSWTEEDRLEKAEQICVMGRSSPNDKLLLVKALRKNGNIVAVTGDGTNDAPALHEADIGLSMGIQGTEVAKESSDIIILDDNFATVVKVVRWGRSVYANIQKFIQFQLTVNVAALIINVVSAVSSGDVPLNAVQLLWVNLIMDTLGALALATEPPTDHLMKRKPVGKSEPLVTNIMWRNLLLQAIYQVTVLLVLNFEGIRFLRLIENDSDRDHAEDMKNTMIFNTFVLCQVFNEFNARKPDEFNVFSGVTRNHLFMGIVALTVILQVLIIEFLGKFTSTVRLSWKMWLVSVVIAFISWPLAAVGKFLPVPQAEFGAWLGPKLRNNKCLRSWCCVSPSN